MKTNNHLLHKNWEDCSLVQEVEGGVVKAETFFGLVLVNHLLQQLIQINTSFTTRSTTKRMVQEIRGSKATAKKLRKSMSHETTSGKTPSKFAILFHVKSSDFRFTWFM